MVQVLQPAKPKKTFAQKLNQGVGAALETATKYYEENKENEALKARIDQENQFLKSQGHDISGINNEKLRQLYLAESLRGQSKKQQKEEEGKFLEKLFSKGDKSVTPQEIYQNSQQQGSTQQENGSTNDIDSIVDKLSDEDIAEAEIRRHGLGTTLQGLRESGRKAKSGEEKETRRQFEADRAFHSKVSDKVVAEADEALKNEPVEKAITAQLRKDIASGNVSGLFPYMVDKLGLESFRNPESARFTNEVKNKFVESLRDIPGARPNMFIERFLSGAQPQIGRSQEANMSVLDLDAFIKDMKYERAKKIREVAKEDRKELGYVKNDVVERADDKMGNFANQRQEEMAYDIRKRHEDAMEDQDLLSEIIGGNVDQAPVTLRSMRLLMIKNNYDAEKAVEEAKKLGMVFPNKKTYGRYEE